jgi:hypothetical protein
MCNTHRCELSGMQTSLLLNVLEARVSYIRVHHGGALVTPLLYEQVARAIRDGRIRIVRRTDIREHSAQYSTQQDQFEFRGDWLDATATHRRLALFVHEASHAVSDMRHIRIREGAEEAVAFVAQAMYLEHNRVPPQGVPHMAHLSSASRAIARHHLRHEPVPEQEWTELVRTVSRHPRYANRAARVRVMDGV